MALCPLADALGVVPSTATRPSFTYPVSLHRARTCTKSSTSRELITPTQQAWSRNLSIIVGF